MIAVITALDQETSGIRKQLESPTKKIIGKAQIWEGTLRGAPLVLARSGIGRERVEAVVTNLADSYALNGIVSWGFGGALIPELKTGDIVICSHMSLDPDHEGPTPELPTETEQQNTKVFHSDKNMVDLAMEIGLKEAIELRQGGSLTLDHIAEEPEEKKNLGEKYPVIVAEMEAYWLAAIAQEIQMPFLSVRAISDAMGVWVPDIKLFVNEDASINVGQLTQYLLRHPNKVPAMAILGTYVRRASRNLAGFGTELLPRIDAMLSS